MATPSISGSRRCTLPTLMGDAMKAHGHSLGCVILQQRREELEINQFTMFSLSITADLIRSHQIWPCHLPVSFVHSYLCSPSTHILPHQMVSFMFFHHPLLFSPNSSSCMPCVSFLWGSFLHEDPVQEISVTSHLVIWGSQMPIICIPSSWLGQSVLYLCYYYLIFSLIWLYANFFS